MRFAPQVLSALLLFAAATGVAQAQSITNGSFEGQSVSGTAFSGANDGRPGKIDTFGPGNALQNWEVTSGTVDLVENIFQQAPGAAGKNVVDLRGVSSGTIRQLVSGFTAGVTYLLSWDMAANPGVSENQIGTPGNKNIAVSVYEMLGESFSQNFSLSRIGFTLANVGWTKPTFQFTPTKSASYYVQFSTLPDSFANTTSGNVDACCLGMLVDNVALSAVAVPGPAAGAGLPVAAFAAGGMMWLRRRRAVAKAVAA
jgi:hypothetical protein